MLGDVCSANVLGHHLLASIDLDAPDSLTILKTAQCLEQAAHVNAHAHGHKNLRASLHASLRSRTHINTACLACLSFGVFLLTRSHPYPDFIPRSIRNAISHLQAFDSPFSFQNAIVRLELKRAMRMLSSCCRILDALPFHPELVS